MASIWLSRKPVGNRALLIECSFAKASLVAVGATIFTPVVASVGIVGVSLGVLGEAYIAVPYRAVSLIKPDSHPGTVGLPEGQEPDRWRRS